MPIADVILLSKQVLDFAQFNLVAQNVEYISKCVFPRRPGSQY